MHINLNSLHIMVIFNSTNLLSCLKCVLNYHRIITYITENIFVFGNRYNQIQVLILFENSKVHYTKGKIKFSVNIEFYKESGYKNIHV